MKPWSVGLASFRGVNTLIIADFKLLTWCRPAENVTCSQEPLWAGSSTALPEQFLSQWHQIGGLAVACRDSQGPPLRTERRFHLDQFYWFLVYYWSLRLRTLRCSKYSLAMWLLGSTQQTPQNLRKLLAMACLISKVDLSGKHSLTASWNHVWLIFSYIL